MNVSRIDFAPTGAGPVHADGRIPSQNLSVVPHFYMDSVLDGIASNKAGRLIYRSVEMVLLTFAGANGQTIRRKVLDHDRKEYAPYYEAFKKGNQEMVIDGTDLRNWPMIDRAQAETFAAMQVRTVEQLANLSDSQLMGMGMGAHKLRSKAQDWLAISSNTAEGMRAAEKNRELEAANADLAARVKDLEARVQGSNRMMQMMQSNVRGAAIPADTAASLQQASELDPGPSPAMAEMLAKANGLNPEVVRAQHVTQDAQFEALGLPTTDERPHLEGALPEEQMFPEPTPDEDDLPPLNATPLE